MLWYSEHENMRKPILRMTPIDQIWNSFITTNTIPNDTRQAQFVTNSVFTTNLNSLLSWTCKDMLKKTLWPKAVFQLYQGRMQLVTQKPIQNTFINIIKWYLFQKQCMYFVLQLPRVCNGRNTHNMCSNKESPKSCF